MPRSIIHARLLPGAVLACGIGAALSGCAANKHQAARMERCGGHADSFQHGHVYPDTFVGNQAASCEMVFGTPWVVQRLSELDERDLSEYWRNDGRMQVRSNGPLLASDDWPQAEQPSLDYARRLWIDPNPNTLLYFRTPSEAYRSYRWYAPAGTATWNSWR